MKNEENVVVKDNENKKNPIKWAKAKWAAISSWIAVQMFSITSSADTPTDADGTWNAIINWILPWFWKFGVVVIIIGVVEFALGFKDDDANSKVKGMKTIIAGVLVTAVGGLAATLGLSTTTPTT